jgi:hypothetical protein
MNSSKVNFQRSNYSRKYLEWTMVILSSLLLGIWAVKETIALRNILLFGGAPLSIYYITQEFKRSNLKEQYDFWRILPIILLGLSFFWVLCHFIFFSIDPVQQFSELKSTWLRALMASIMGLATGLALRNHPNRLNLLWLGIFITFIALFYQYAPRALAQQKLLVPDYDHYLFHLKINVVLMGTILLAGIDGALFDHLRFIQYRWRYFRISYLLFWLFGTLMTLWSFVFIVDTRNGIGLSTILYAFWFICATAILIQGQMKQLNLRRWLLFLFAGAGLLLILYFGFMQIKVNSGWSSLAGDAKIAVQIDRYPNWQNLAQFGYPKREDGQIVSSNNYERVAWAVAGSRAIFQNPTGVGILSFPFTIHPQRPPNMQSGAGVLGIATHSGWIELGLAFGVPMLALIFANLCLLFGNALRGAYPAKMTILGLIILIFFLYTVGEVAIDHGLEILFYFLALIPALMLTETNLRVNILKNSN